MKTSRACTGMLSSENDDFKFLKSVKNCENNQKHCTIIPGLVELFYIFQTSPSLARNIVDQKHERKSSHRAVLYIIQTTKI